MKTMILAAGFGTRLRPYSLRRPKPLFPILDRPLLTLLIDQVRRAGGAEILVNGHHLQKQVARQVAGDPAITFQAETRILGTGGSLRRALSWCAARPLLVMNGDIVHTVDLAAVYDFHLAHPHAVTMVLHHYPRFNNVLVRDNRVRAFGVTAAETARRGEILAFTGIHVLDPRVLHLIPPHGFHNIIDLYRQLIDTGETIAALRIDSGPGTVFWRDIGTPADYLELHGDLLHKRISLPFTARIPAAQKNGFPLFGLHGAEIGAGVRLQDWVCIGRGAEISPGARLKRCVVWPGARVRTGSYEDAILM